MNYPPWLILYKRALLCESFGNHEMAADLMRKALLSAYESGWLDDLLPPGGIDVSIRSENSRKNR